MEILIAGLGVMGASLALAIRNTMPSVVITGYDLPGIPERALVAGVIDRVISDWPGQAATARLIFLATPIRTIRRHLTELNGVVGPDTIVTDVGSTKADLAALAREIKFSGTYIGGHPMTGAEKKGLAAADPLLYENAVYIVNEFPPELETRFKLTLLPVLQAIKARIYRIDPEVHDKILSAISHLPQILAIALINLTGSRNSEQMPCFELAAGGFRDLTRIAGSSIEVWQDIFDSNKVNITETLDQFIAILEQYKSRLQAMQPDFDQANRYREYIPKYGKGFLSPLTDVLVYVSDQTGVISRVSTALFEKNIDIRDMELLKVREKEGGVFRLSFASRSEAGTAVEVLGEIGFKAFIRE